jgi:hypothetical protein
LRQAVLTVDSTPRDGDGNDEDSEVTTPSIEPQEALHDFDDEDLYS